MEKRLISVDLGGKNALVTGGAKGIGLAISRALAGNKANVAINYNTSADSANALAKQFQTAGVRAIAIQADVTVPEQAQRLVCDAQRLWVALSIFWSTTQVARSSNRPWQKCPWNSGTRS